MAEAPGHLIGQIIGNALEAAIEPFLRELAIMHDLYLDSIGPRPGVRTGKLLKWADGLGNWHSLDYVLERGGTPTKQGNPAAFIEAAWRRYTKHSRAKAQEMQGALLPIVAKWSNVAPVPAAVVAGVWTADALEQMRSSGFVLLHIPYETIVKVFSKFGVDVAGQGERTPDEFWQRQVDAYGRLSDSQKEELHDVLRRKANVESFALELERRMIRTVQRVVVIPLHGTERQFEDVQSAIDLVTTYSTSPAPDPFVRFEIRIIYTNGDKIEATFAVAADAAAFLETFA